MPDSLPYFAYGSNMLTARLRHRVPGSRPWGRGFVEGLERRFHKRGRDGSGKCGLVPAASREARLWGVVFELPTGGKEALDAIEGVGRGYQTVELEVRIEGRRFRAFSYRAQVSFVDEALRPFTWYRDLVVAGAAEHRLPDPVVETLRVEPATPDPDRERARAERRLLAATDVGGR